MPLQLRVALLAALLAGLAGLWLLVRVSARVRRHRRVNRISEPGLSEGKPTILFFTGEFCTICHYRQKPALDGLTAQRGGDFRVVELDAAREPALSRRFGVLSLPSTVVLAADGTVAAVNYGFAPGAQLDAQLETVST